MILLADSGSTKTDWCVADGAAEICRIATHGTNPFFQSADEIARSNRSAFTEPAALSPIRSP